MLLRPPLTCRLPQLQRRAERILRRWRVAPGPELPHQGPRVGAARGLLPARALRAGFARRPRGLGALLCVWGLRGRRPTGGGGGGGGGSEGVEADATTYNSVLLAQAMLASEEPGRAEAAHAAFEEMRRRGLAPDRLSYSALATAFANAGMDHRALQARAAGDARAVGGSLSRHVPGPAGAGGGVG
jgi:hypothetical protein